MIHRTGLLTSILVFELFCITAPAVAGPGAYDKRQAGWTHVCKSQLDNPTSKEEARIKLAGFTAARSPQESLLSVDLVSDRALVRRHWDFNWVSLVDITDGTERMIYLSNPDESVIVATLSPYAPIVCMAYYEGKLAFEDGIYETTVEVQNLATGESQFLFGHKANITDMIYLSDGITMLTATGRVTHLMTQGSSEVNIVIAPDAAVRRWNLNTSSLEAIWEAPSPVYNIVLDEEGSLVYAIMDSPYVENNKNAVAVLDLADLSLIKLYELENRPESVAFEPASKTVIITTMNSAESISIDGRSLQ